MKVISDVEGFDRVLAYWKKRGANMFRINQSGDRLILVLIRQSVSSYFTKYGWKSRISDDTLRTLEVSPELNLPGEYFKGTQSL